MMEESSEAACSKLSARESLSEDTDSESDFFGFDITDVRDIFTEAIITPIFTSTPKKKARRLSDIEFDSDSDVTETTNAVQKVEHTHQLSDDSDTDSDISGELIGSIFQEKRAKVEYPSPLSFSDHSESDISGELSVNCGTTLTNVSDQDETVAEKSYDEEPDCENNATRKGKHRSTVLSSSQLVNGECCKEKCFRKLSLEQLQKARDNFCKQYPSYELQRKMILNWFEDNQPEKGKFVFTISGLPVCWTAWTKTLGITPRRFYSLKSDYLKGRRSEKHGSFATIGYSDETDKAIKFLERYFKEHCDYMPNVPQWHLSSNTKRSDVYQDMCKAMKAQGTSVCSNATFRSVWRTHFSHVKIPKENRFGKCDTCANIREALRNGSTEDEAISKRKTDHRNFVRNERATYFDRCAAGHQHPNKSFSIAIDGMDQNKTELPFTVWRHSSLEKAWRLKVHVVGAIIHGRHPITFLDYQQHSHDSNMTANVLLQTLWIHRDVLPSTLYLQLDNTCKENKNQHVFAFLSYLVETKIFDKIEACFLPVGHTHIDVDQMFSRLSVGIARRGAKTFQDLLKLIHCCYTQTQGEVNQEGARPQYSRIKHLYAIREWLQPYAVEMHLLRDYHHFMFVRNEEEKCIVDFKPWCSSTPLWDRKKWPPLGPVFRELPQGVPDLIKPNFESVGFNRLENMVNKCTEKGILSVSEKKLWEDFLSQEISYAESYEDVEEIQYDDRFHKSELAYIACEEDRWPINDLIIRQRPNEEEVPCLDEVLRASEAYEQGEGLLPVYTGRYRPPKDKQSQIIQDQDIRELEVGMLVALEMEKYPERPLIAEIKEFLPDNGMTVQWYSGSWTTKWAPAKRKHGRQWLEWVEDISRDCVVLFDFSLTKSGKLRTHSVRHLKECYGID